MSQRISETVSRALAGAPRCKRWACVGTNVRGESFRLTYFDRYDAEDFAREIRSKGGSAEVSRLS